MDRDARTYPRNRRSTRTQDEKCEDILSYMIECRITMMVFLTYLFQYRTLRTVRQPYAHVKRYWLEQIPQETKIFTLSEWRTSFNAGLWRVVEQLLRLELLAVAQVPGVTGDIITLSSGDSDPSEQDPIIPVDAIHSEAPQLIGLLHAICQPKESSHAREAIPLLRLSYFITLLCYLQQRKVCEALPVAIGCFLKSNGLTRKGLETLNGLGVVSSYQRIRKAEDSQMVRTRAQIHDMKYNAGLNITIDNFDLDRGVVDERLGEHGTHTSATTGLVNIGVEIPKAGLTQGMIDNRHRLDALTVLEDGWMHKEIPKVRWSFQAYVSQIHGIMDL